MVQRSMGESAAIDAPMADPGLRFAAGDLIERESPDGLSAMGAAPLATIETAVLDASPGDEEPGPVIAAPPGPSEPRPLLRPQPVARALPARSWRPAPLQGAPDLVAERRQTERPAERPAERLVERPANRSLGRSPDRAAERSPRAEPAVPTVPPGDAGQPGLERVATAPQLRRFIKSRAYVPMHELRRRFAINGGEDDVTAVDLDRLRIYVGLPEREGRLLGELLKGGDIGYELSLDPISPVVVGVYPMRPVTRG
jgi:hypothetical protein